MKNFVSNTKWKVIRECPIYNLFWGDWVDNRLFEVWMICGNCKCESKISVREKKWFGKCPCCEVTNVFSKGTSNDD